MDFDEFTAAMESATQTMRLANRRANTLARVLEGRLRFIDDENLLARLKRELAGFNSKTGRWRA